MRIDAEHLSLAYGDVVALRDLSADVQGRVIGVLGATASGKTSLLQIIGGLIAPSDGQVRIDGDVVRPKRTREVAYVPQETGAFPFFQRPKETMELALGLRGVPPSGDPDRFLEALGLGEDDRSATGYSTGMKQKVRIAYAMLHTPRVLVLDEPMTGLDVRERFRVLRLLDRLRELVTVIFHPPSRRSRRDLRRDPDPEAGASGGLGKPVGNHDPRGRPRVRNIDSSATPAGGQGLGHRIGRARRRATAHESGRQRAPRSPTGIAAPDRCLRASHQEGNRPENRGGSDPKPPGARRAPAERWRPSTPLFVHSSEH